VKIRKGLLDVSIEEIKEQLKNVTFRINKLEYIVDYENEIQLNDLVYDIRDNSYGYVDMLKNGKACVKDGYVAEGNIDIKFLVRLKDLIPEKLRQKDKLGAFEI